MSKSRKQLIVDNWNLRHKVGTKVLYWPGVKEGPGKASVTTSEAEVFQGHTPAVLIAGVGIMALSHVEAECQETLHTAEARNA